MSTIPAAIDGLISALKMDRFLASIPIIDGQPTTDLPKDYLAIGYSDDEGNSVSGSQTPAGLGGLRREEKFTIACEVSSWVGTTVMKTARDRAFLILGNVETVVRNDGTLGGAVAFSDFGQTIEVSQVQTDQGAVVTIRFNVAIKITRI